MVPRTGLFHQRVFCGCGAVNGEQQGSSFGTEFNQRHADAVRMVDVKLPHPVLAHLLLAARGWSSAALLEYLALAHAVLLILTQ